MKKIKSVAVIVLIATLFTSCKKDYTCTCSETISGTATVVGNINIHDSKKNAESKCAQLATSDFGGTGAFVACKLN